MARKDNSKRTSYRVWCHDCKETIRISTQHQRLPQPTHCPFCGSKDLLVESIRTHPRAA